MKTIIITPQNKTQLSKLSRLLKELKIDATYLSETEKEDLGLKMLMREANRSKTVSRAAIMKKLRTARKLNFYPNLAKIWIE